MADVVALTATVADFAATTASKPTLDKVAFASMTSDSESDFTTGSTKSRSSSQDGLSTDEGYTSCSEFAHSSDSEAGDEDAASGGFATPRGTSVYPLTLMLQFRILVGVCASPLVYSTRPREDEAHSSKIREEECEPSPKSASSPSKKAPLRAVDRLRDAVVNNLGNGEKKVSSSKEAPLAASPTSWAAQLKQRRCAESASGDAEVARAVRSILNKLTVERFDGLYEQLTGCGIASPSHIAILVREIFEKATAQHSFIPMYADLCARLESDERFMAAAKGNNSGETANAFRRTLLNQCQNSFETLLDSSDIVCGDSSDEELQEMKRAKRKQCALGNVKLVGHLLTRGMLSSKLLLTCCQELIGGHEQCPEALESLAALLTVVGPTFDTPRWDYHSALEAIFAQVRAIVARSSPSEVPSRVRFLFRDVLELRQNQWTDMKKATTQSKGPMKLEEVRESANTLEVSPKQMPKTAPAMRGPRSNRGARDAQRGATVPSPPSKPSCVPPLSGLARAATSLMHATSKKDADAVKSAQEDRDMEARAMQRLSTLVSIASAEGGSNPSGLSLAPSAAPWFNPNFVAQGASPTCKGKNARPQASNQASPKVVRPSLSMAPAKPVVVPAPIPEPLVEAPFDRSVFRRELSSVLRELSVSHDVAAAVRRIRQQKVPLSHQASEFSDLLTRAAEESRGPARRSAFAFSAGLANGDFSAFDRAKCAEGIAAFFREVYEDLCEEVPRLPAIVSAELLPTLRAAIPATQLNAVVPTELLH